MLSVLVPSRIASVIVELFLKTATAVHGAENPFEDLDVETGDTMQ